MLSAKRIKINQMPNEVTGGKYETVADHLAKFLTGTQRMAR